MKKVILFLVLVNFSSCKAQKNSASEKLIIPKAENSFEKFDIADFQNNVDSVSGKRTIIQDQIHIEEDYQDPGYARVTYDANSSFHSLKLFYEDGNIKMKGVCVQ